MRSRLRFERITNVDIYRDRASAANAHALSGRGKDSRHTRFVSENILKHLSLTSATHLLDVGCGSGDLLVAASKLINHGTGTVPSIEERNRLHQEIGVSNLTFAVGAADGLPLEKQSVDTIVMNGVILLLESLQQAKESLAEIARVVRPGGEVWLGEAACQEFVKERRTYTGSSVFGYFAHAVEARGWRGGISAFKDLYHAFVKARPILLRNPPLITPRKWIVETAAELGLELEYEEQHVGLNLSGEPSTSEYRRNFKFRKANALSRETAR